MRVFLLWENLTPASNAALSQTRHSERPLISNFKCFANRRNRPSLVGKADLSGGQSGFHLEEEMLSGA
jgi:hypothetical protein